MLQILVPIREALRKPGAALAVTFAVRRERLDVGGSILIRGWTSSSIFLVEGDGVPQNRLMKADDSCRVENAGVKPWRCAAQASFCPSTQSKVTMSRAPGMVRAIGKVVCSWGRFLATFRGTGAPSEWCR